MIRLRFSSTHSFIPSALIRWRTGALVSHVEFIDDRGWTLGSRWSMKAADNGVRLRPPKSTDGQINVVHATFPGIESAYVRGIDLIGTPYNLRGIFGIITARNWTDKDKMDCSNFVVRAAERAGVYLLRDNVIEPWKITPRDILLSKEITLL